MAARPFPASHSSRTMFAFSIGGYNPLRTFKRLSLGVAFATITATAAVGLGTTPAFATTLMSCTGGSGSSTLSPGISNTPTQQTISGTDTLTGCNGGGFGITGGTVTVANLKTVQTGNPPAQPTCASLGTPPPKGTITALGGTANTTWSDGSTSQGVIKLKSTGVIGQVNAVVKITSGRFFASGHTTKSKGVVTFTPASGQTCPTLTMVNDTNSTTTITQI
jgi:hypothetical protein